MAQRMSTSLPLKMLWVRIPLGAGLFSFTFPHFNLECLKSDLSKWCISSDRMKIKNWIPCWAAWADSSLTSTEWFKRKADVLTIIPNMCLDQSFRWALKEIFCHWERVTRAVPFSDTYQLSDIRIEPGTTRWEAQTLPLCYAVHTFTAKLSEIELKCVRNEMD